MDEALRQSLRVPMWCPVCKMVMKGDKSNTSYYNYNCCSNCFIQFVEGREERWKNGWRPDEKQLQTFYDSLKDE